MDQETILLEQLPDGMARGIFSLAMEDNFGQKLTEYLSAKPDLLQKFNLSVQEAAEKIEMEINVIAAMVAKVQGDADKPPFRVKVWNGDQSQYLGEGTYEGRADVHFIRRADGSLRSLKDAEQEPPQEMLEPGDELVTSHANPKIRLDTGQVVYGCQVWWDKIKEEPTLQQ